MKKVIVVPVKSGFFFRAPTFLLDFLLQIIKQFSTEELPKCYFQTITEFFDGVYTQFFSAAIQHAVDRWRRYAWQIGKFVRANVSLRH